MIAAALLSSVAADAAEYVVRRGDTLSGIATKFTGKSANYKALAKLNGISNPNLIRIGQKLIIPDGVYSSEKHSANSVDSKPSANKSVEFLYKFPGRDPYKGSLKDALEMLGYPSEVSRGLEAKVASNHFTWMKINKGDRLAAMTFGKMKFRRNVIAAWENSNHSELAKLYEIEADGKIYRLLCPIVCGNWSRLSEIEVPQVPKVEVPPQEEPKEHFPEPEVKVPETRENVDFPVEKPCCPIEHEPIIGAGVWGNGVANGSFEYAEYMAWLKRPVFDCDSEYAWGIGLYGNMEQGDSDSSSYTWSGHAIGVQTGFKWSSAYYDEEDKKYRLQQVTTKLRLVWEDTTGHNSEGYRMHQDSTKLGLYAEYVRELDDRWMAMGVAEGWLGIGESIKSTWSGDSPSERGQIMLAGYGQYKFNDDWSLRFGGGPFYQQWDDMYGIHARAEMRWRNRLMFGPYVNFFPFGMSDAYSGISASDLTGIGAFVRYEFGEDIREWYEKRRMERVWAIPNKDVESGADNPEKTL